GVDLIDGGGHGEPSLRAVAPVVSRDSPGLRLPPRPLRRDPEAQRVEPDEAGGVALVVAARAFLEGHEVLVVERQRAPPADDGRIALVQFELHDSGNMLLT